MNKLLLKVTVKLITIFFIFSSLTTFGQNNETNKIYLDFFASFDLKYFNEFNISKEFKKNNLPNLNNYLFGITGGSNIIYGKNLLNIDYSIYTDITYKTNELPKSKFNITSQSLSYYRQIFSIYDDLVFIGLGYEHSTYSALFYLKSAPLNISNISPNDFSNVLHLYNSSHSLRPGLMLKIRNKSFETSTSIRISYSLNLYQSKWESVNSSTNNTIIENFNHLTLSYSYFF